MRCCRRRQRQNRRNCERCSAAGAARNTSQCRTHPSSINLDNGPPEKQGSAPKAPEMQKMIDNASKNGHQAAAPRGGHRRPVKSRSNV
eukprot:gene18531-biopygen23421